LSSATFSVNPLPVIVDNVVPDVGCIASVSAYDTDGDVFNDVLIDIVVMVAPADVTSSPRVEA